MRLSKKFVFLRLILSVVFLLALHAEAEETPPIPAPTPASKEATAEEIDALVLQLGDDDVDIRRAAESKLDAIGEKTRIALDKALLSNDLEVSTVAKKLLAKLQLGAVVFLAYDSDGKPAAGCTAEMVLHNQSSPNQNFNGFNGGNPNDGPKPMPLVFDADGIVKIPGQKWGPTNFSFTFKDDWVSTSYAYGLTVRTGSNPQIMEVYHGSKISGHVVDAEGKPIKDAVVRLDSNGSADAALLLELQSVYPVAADENQGRWGGGILGGHNGEALVSEPTDAAGKFKIERVKSGVYSWIVTADGYATRAARAEGAEGVGGVGGVLRVRESQSLELEPVKLQKINYGKLDIALTFPATETKDAKDVKPGPATKDAKKGDKCENVVWKLVPIFTGSDADKRAKICETYCLFHYGNHTLTEKEEGKLPTLEKLAEGHYRLEVVASNTPHNQNRGMSNRCEYVCEDVEIKAGAADAAPIKISLTPVPLYELTGTVLGLGANKHVTILAVPEQKIADLVARHFDFQNQRNSLYEGMSQFHTINATADGSYKLKLRAGRYCLILAQNQECVFQYGVEVKEAGASVAPDVTWISPKIARSALTKLTVNVMGPDLKKIENVQTALRFKNGGGWGGNGTFFDLSQMTQAGFESPDYLMVQLAGYHTAKVDVSKLVGEVTQDVVLQKCTYGDLKVTVQDESGQPLEGAYVFYSNQQRNGDARALSRYKSDEQGRVDFRRMKEGSRRLKVMLDGYFCEKEPEVTIKSAEPQDVKIVLKKGLVMTGTVKIPADYKLPVQIEPYATYMGKNVTDSVLVENGKFTFKGLPPGKYTINPSAVGLVSIKSVNVTLSPDGKLTEPIEMEMVRGATGVFNVSKNWAGQSISFHNTAEFGPAGSWVRGEAEDEGRFRAYQQPVGVDATGRVECRNVMPTEFLVGHTPSVGDYAYENDGQVQNVAATRIIGRFKAEKFCTAKEVSALEGPTFQDISATAKVQMRLEWDTTANAATTPRPQGGYLASSFRLLGEKAIASIYKSDPWNGNRQNAEIRVLGTTDPKLIPAEQTPSTIHGLPAGEYKLYQQVYWNKYNETVAKEHRKPILLKTFTLKEGETLNLGEIKITLPALPESATKPNENEEDQWNGYEENTEGPIFQP